MAAVVTTHAANVSTRAGVGKRRGLVTSGSLSRPAPRHHETQVDLGAPDLHDRTMRRVLAGPAAVAALVACAACAACMVGWSAPAQAADADQLTFAAHEHDLGYRAYVAKSFDEAATHFENAFFAAPNPAELRSAIRARKEAGELARSATLAVIGQRKYPGDASIGKLADEVLAEAKPRVYEVRLTSGTECNVAVDEKVVLAERLRDQRFFVDPGKHELDVGWSDDRTKRVPIVATAGGSQSLALEAPPIPPKPIVPPPSAAEGPAPSSKPLGPVVFLTGAVLTAAGAGVTIGSGIDTQNHPGTAAVKADCVGQGASCPQYQQGLDAQRRTNILLAATGGVAAVTVVVGVFFTQWSHADHPRTGSAAAPASASRGGITLEPAFGFGQAGLIGSF
jgi:hypothetical protein